MIQTTWTKRSRGQPGAERRASVPEALPIQPLDPVSGVAVFSFTAAEHDGFELHGSTVASDLPVGVAGTRILREGGLLKVLRLAHPTGGWPTDGYDKVAFTLREDETGRVIWNRRHSTYSGWSYEKCVVNVANTATPRSDLFTSSPPTHLLDEQAHLF